MRILVTGATGFLGTALCRSLAARGDAVTALGSRQCDLRQAGGLDAFNGDKYDMIYHLAAWTQAGDFCLKHPGEQWIVNQRINTNVLAWWHERHPKARLVATGTSCSYAPGHGLTEDRYLEGQPHPTLMAYAMSKRMLLCGLQALHQQFQLQYL